ncbi:exosome complex exonuclease RRP4 [Botrytis cinerea]
MAITIIAPVSAAVPYHAEDESDHSDDGGVDVEGDLDMQLSKRAQHQNIVTPGEVITDDPQWMRGHGTYVAPASTEIIGTVAEIGDLVVGRIIEVQSKRWRVDIGAPVLANLPLSAINLPGGIQRKRTETDELQIRTFFSEGDLLVAEVQQLYQDGSASLHTRSLKYGKLRNGVFMAVSGTGGGGGVVRARRQVWTIDTAHNGGKVDIILGVNGYIWICKTVEVKEGETSITRIEESVSNAAYSSQNDEIIPETRREIARIKGVIQLLVEEGLRVDEDMVNKAYAAAIEVDEEDEGESSAYVGGEIGKRVLSLISTT